MANFNVKCFSFWFLIHLYLMKSFCFFKFDLDEFMSFCSSEFTLLPTGGGGGGGNEFLSHIIRLLVATVIAMASKLCDFLFLPFGHIMTKF